MLVARLPIPLMRLHKHGVLASTSPRQSLLQFSSTRPTCLPHRPTLQRSLKDQITYAPKVRLFSWTRRNRTYLRLYQTRAVLTKSSPPTPSDGKPSTHRSCHLSNQATAMAAAYLETGFLSDLQRAIRLAEEANAATPTDHPHCARHLALLAGFWVEFRRRMRAGASVGAEEKIDTAKLVSCGDGESAVV